MHCKDEMPCNYVCKSLDGRFLGLGVQTPTASWGNMLDNAVKYIQTAPWLWFFPGLLILLTVLCINFVGDGLRDALDPRSTRHI